LSGDNAVVIALACRGLPDDCKRMDMVLGAGVAIGLRRPHAERPHEIEARRSRADSTHVESALVFFAAFSSGEPGSPHSKML
jgi:hypothetical protein